jgi:hypothetical protein
MEVIAGLCMNRAGFKLIVLHNFYHVNKFLRMLTHDGGNDYNCWIRVDELKICFKYMLQLPGAHPAFYPMGAMGAFPGGKAAGA